MARPRVTNLLDTACAAYIAGLVDGEGTITLSRMHRNERRRLVVCISNNELAILGFVLAAIGAGKVTSKRTYEPLHAASYTYQISSQLRVVEEMVRNGVTELIVPELALKEFHKQRGSSPIPAGNS